MADLIAALIVIGGLYFIVDTIIKQMKGNEMAKSGTKKPGPKKPTGGKKQGGGKGK